MLNYKGSQNLHRIAVLNPKGGSGKSTLAFNIAGYLAVTGRRVALVDMDPQGSSLHWLTNRPSSMPRIEGVAAPFDESGADQCIVIPEPCDYVVVDAPAGVPAKFLSDFTCGAHAILIPVLPSTFDIQAASRLIADLLLVALVSRRKGRLGIVANRVKARTIPHRRLERFLDSLSISAVGTLRDSQNYFHSAERGLSIHEMPTYMVRKDLEQWQAVTEWLETKLALPLSPRDWLRPENKPVEQHPVARWQTLPRMPAAAAALGALGVAMWLWLWLGGQADPAPRATPELARASESPPEAYALAGAPAEAAGLDQVGITSLSGARAIEREPVLELLDPVEAFKQRWQLSGVVHADGSSVVLLSDRTDHTTRRVLSSAEVDGWVVTEAGPNYAVFSRDEAEVKLLLSRDLTLEPEPEI